MASRKIEKLTVVEFVEAVYELNVGKVLRVRFKDKPLNQWECDSPGLWHVDVRKMKDKGDGMVHMIFSICEAHHSEEGDMIGEALFCYRNDIATEKLCKFVSKKEPLKLDADPDYDENVMKYIEAIKSLAGIKNKYNKGRNIIDYTWYENWSDWRYDYSHYLKNSHKDDF